jgi:hypothetical protein
MQRENARGMALRRPIIRIDLTSPVYIYLKEFLHVLQHSKQRIFLLLPRMFKNKHRKIERTASYGALDITAREGMYISADHCQKGTSKELYNIYECDEDMLYRLLNSHKKSSPKKSSPKKSSPKKSFPKKSSPKKSLRKSRKEPERKERREQKGRKEKSIKERKGRKEKSIKERKGRKEKSIKERKGRKEKSIKERKGRKEKSIRERKGRKRK